VRGMRPIVGLAAVNFFLADVQGGLGPFLATWLAEAAHWNPARVGLVITVSGLVGLACNTPAGALVDRLEWPAVGSQHRPWRPWRGRWPCCRRVALRWSWVLAAQFIAAAGGGP
jgi:hypothetical protein